MMVRDMATQSFFEDLILDTPEAVANMEKAFEKYEKEGGYKVRNQLKLCTDRTTIERFMGIRDQTTDTIRLQIRTIILSLN